MPYQALSSTTLYKIDSFNGEGVSFFSYWKGLLGLDRAVDQQIFIEKHKFSSPTVARNYEEVEESLAAQTFSVPLPRLQYRNIQDIEYFLKKNTQVNSYIQLATRAAREYFPSASLAIELISDPESDEASAQRTLFMYIKTSIPPHNAMELLDRLDLAVFEQHPEISPTLFNFNLEFT